MIVVSSYMPTKERTSFATYRGLAPCSELSASPAAPGMPRRSSSCTEIQPRVVEPADGVGTTVRK